MHMGIEMALDVVPGQSGLFMWFLCPSCEGELGTFQGA